jgi:subtilisin family serine protease
MRLDNLRRWSSGFVMLAAVVLTVWSAERGLPRTEAGEGTAAERAAALVSEATGRPAHELSVARTAFLPDRGIRRYKIVDAQGDIHGVDLDAAGNPVSGETVALAIQDLNNRAFVGKLEAELARHLSVRGDDSPIKVVFSLAGATFTPVPHEGRTIRAQVAAIVKPLVDQLRARGERVIYQAEYAPMVVASVRPSTIRAMEARSNVERIYLERVHSPDLNISKVVVQATTVNNRGITGHGERVGIVEMGQIGAHPNLPAAQRILCGPPEPVSGHKTQVAGVIQSNHPANTGVASGIIIVDGIAADFSDGELMRATDCVIGKGASAVNMSFGTPTGGQFDAFARFVDMTVYKSRRTIVKSAGNDCTRPVTSPAIAFNALVVGAFSDRNTTSFGDDVDNCTLLGVASAFLDPISPNNDREEPDVVAPGHLILTTAAGGLFVNSTGTSFAAPHVTGGVGLLTQRLPAAHKTQPERVRAIMMASARHNIEGASRLSEQDGAGAIMLAAADRVLQNKQSFFFTDPGGIAGFPINQEFSAKKGERVRVAIAWAHKSPGGDKLTQPTTDLDLTVLDPGGVVLATSASFDNNYEIVEFIAPLTGIYRARITNFRASPGDEFIGLAVSRTNT